MAIICAVGCWVATIGVSRRAFVLKGVMLSQKWST